MHLRFVIAMRQTSLPKNEMRVIRSRARHACVRNIPDGARRRFPVQIESMSTPSIPSRQVDDAADELIMPLFNEVSQLKRFMFRCSARTVRASDGARCIRNRIILCNVAAWILIILAVREIFF